MADMSGGDGDVYRAPFTAVQWQELEHQALIYKYLVAGVPVPSDFILSIRRSLEALSARLFNYHNLGYGSYYGTKFDPEPGRCRRTDGKKWRCSKDAYHESKYCERHMHRGRNRSRKPVESQSSAVSQITTLNSTGCGKGSYQNVSSTSSPSQSLFSVSNSASLDFGSKASKLHVADTCPYVTNNKDLRYSQGLTVNVDCQNYPSGGNVRGLGMNSNANDSWRLMSTSQVPTNSLLRPQNDSYLLSNSLKLNMPNAFEPMIDTTSMSKERQQHFFSGSEEVGSQDQVKHDQHSMHPFFNDLPKAKEVWSNFDVTTQLSMSMDPDYNTRNDCLPNDA